MSAPSTAAISSSTAAPQAATSSADSDWAAIQVILNGGASSQGISGAPSATSSLPTTSNLSGSTPLIEGVSKSWLDQQIASLQQISALAGAFWRAYPGDTRIEQAEKLELSSGLRAVELGGLTSQTALLQAASTYIGDQSHAVQDRFDIDLITEYLAQRPPGATRIPR